MTESLPRDYVNDQIVASAFRRFGARIAFAVILVGAAIGAYSYLGPHKYQATSTVLVRPLTGNALSSQTATSSQSTTVAMETEASLVTSIAVTERVNTALGTSLSAGGSNVISSVPTNSQIVQIASTAGTARDAQRRAQAYAQAFLDYRSELATQSQKAQLDRLQARVTSVQGQLRQAFAQAAEKNKPADAETQVRLLTSNLASLQSEIGQTELTSTQPGNVVLPASLPDSPTGLSPALLTAGGAFVALVVALAVAIWRERTDDRINGRVEVEFAAIPVLALLPDQLPGPRGDGDPATDQARAEALRRLRTGLLALTTPGSVIALTGLSRLEPAVTAAADIADTIAAAGYRVTLVDAGAPEEIRPPALVGDTGLSDLLGRPLPPHLPTRESSGTLILGAGSDPGTASERYAGERSRTLLRRLGEETDYVIVATAPADTSEGLSMLLAADGVVLIATDRTSTHKQISQTANALQQLGATTIGVLVRHATGVRTRDSSKAADEGARKASASSPMSSKAPKARKGSRKRSTATAVETSGNPRDKNSTGPRASYGAHSGDAASARGDTPGIPAPGSTDDDPLVRPEQIRDGHPRAATSENAVPAQNSSAETIDTGEDLGTDIRLANVKEPGTSSVETSDDDRAASAITAESSSTPSEDTTRLRNRHARALNVGWRRSTTSRSEHDD